MTPSVGKPGPGVKSGDVVTLRILHTNDVHGTITPVPDRVVLGHKAQLGGSAYIATVVDQVRNADPEHTLLLDAGDAVHGQASTDLTEGHAMAEVMNALDYDAGTIGNHDFQWGAPSMEERLKKNDYDNVVANVVHDDGSFLANTKPYVVKEKDGVKIGVLGILTRETLTAQRTDRLEGVQILDEHETATRYLPQMGADINVLLTHEGLDEDVHLANRLPGRGLLIIGGHSHDRVAEPQEVAGNWVVQAGAMGKEVGMLEVDYDRAQGKIVGVRHKLLPVDPATTQPDPEVAAIVEKYVTAADEKMGQVFVQLAQPLTRFNHQDSPMGNVVTDGMRAAVGADISLMNSDGLRTDLAAGDVSLKDLYEVIPFGGELMKGEVTGQALFEALEHSITHREVSQDVQSGFLQVSGLTMEYDASRSPGQRVFGVQVGGQPLDLQRTYSIALEDYLQAGKLGYTSLMNDSYTDTSLTIMDAVQEHLSGTAWKNTAGRRIADRTPV